jgi:hypothetical protein
MNNGGSHLALLSGGDVGEYAGPRKSFFSHVFSTAEESKAELYNTLQYITLAFVPVFALNKMIQRYIPEADSDKSSLELFFEIFVQLIVIFGGIILIHRIVTYIPTYSGFKYEHLSLTNVILAFLVLVLSIQSKLALKANVIYERILDLWDGGRHEEEKRAAIAAAAKKRGGGGMPASARHPPSQADHLDDPAMGMFPPAPVAVSSKPMSQSASPGFGGQGGGMGMMMDMGPMPANFSGSVFGSAF